MPPAQTGERFEWLETWSDSAPEISSELREAIPAHRCPQCGWLEAITETECFRCGHTFDAVVSVLTNKAVSTHEASPKVMQRGKEGSRVRVQFQHNTDIFEGRNDSPELFHLRRRVLERGLMPGFDRLLSLSEINTEIFQHYEHQREVALKALRDMGGVALLADETGLGKTIEASLIAKELTMRGLVRTILIVVPASLTEQWVEEIHEKLGLEGRVVKNFKDWVGEPKIVLTSYATLRGQGVGKHLRERPWDLLICDEAHYLKNRSTKQYKAVNRIAKKYVLLLSATPFHNKLIELKNLLDILKPGLFGSTRAFNKQYVDSQDPRQAINVHHLKTILNEVMIRNRRSKVLVSLPPRRACIVHLELTDPEREFYDAVSKFISEEVKHLLGRYKPRHGVRPGRLANAKGALRRGGRGYSSVLALISLQRETCSSPVAVERTLRKMSKDTDHPGTVREQLAALAEQAAKLGESRKTKSVFEILEKFPGKMVIFCEFLATIDDLYKRCQERGIKAAVFDGRLNIKKKHKTIQRFREDVRVLIASRAGGEGLNIQFCQHMINYDLPWNPMAVEQRIGRLHRLGQKDEVKVFNLSVKDTIEARVLELLTNKIKLFSTVIGELDLILGTMQEDKTFEQLLRESWIQAQVSGQEAQEFQKLGQRLGKAREGYEDLQEVKKSMNQLSP